MKAIIQALAIAPRPRSVAAPAMWPFGSWTPDLANYESPGCTIAENVIPFGPSGYRPFPGLSAYSTALDARCQGATSVPGSDGFTYTYAADASKLYRLDGTTATDASKGGGYTLAADEFCDFLKFDNTILAAMPGNAVQGMTIGGSTFADQFTSTLKPQCRTMARGGRFLMLGNTNETGTAYPTRVRWGQIDSLVNMDASTAAQSGFRDIDADGGWIRRMIGGTFVTIFQERLIQRATYAGPPTVWRFDVVEKNRGALAPYSVIQLGRLLLYAAHDGFYIFDGQESHPIGDLKVNKFFRDNANEDLHFRITSAIDPANQLAMWAYSSNAVGLTNPDRILLYHWPSGWWAYAKVDTEWLFDDLSKGTTLDGLDSVNTSIDALPYSLDSRYWTGGLRSLSAFNSSHQLATFTGSNLAAKIETAVKAFFPGRRTRIKGVHVLVDGGSPTLAVASAQRINDTFTFGSAVAQRAEGYVPLHSTAKYQQFQFNMPSASTWTLAQGLQPIAAPMGSR